MAKDYLDDMLKNPEGEEDARSIPVREAPERTIRNIPVSSARRTARPAFSDLRTPTSNEREPARPSSGNRRGWLWGVAGVSVIVLGGLGLFIFRSTTVTVVPTSHDFSFDQPASFVAYPASSASSESLSYTVVSSDISDSAVVQSTGTETVSEKATGSVTIFNDYSAAPTRLIKNTRFETSTGLIYRITNSVVIPGKKSGVPGSLTATVFADQPGKEYNIESMTRMTVPGLKTTPDMYAHIYARSSTAIAGGFVGDRPAIPAGTLDSARSEIRGRLEAKAHENAKAIATASTVVLPDLVQITYSSLPTTSEAGGGVRIHENAHVDVPVFPLISFGKTVASTIGVNPENADVAVASLTNLVASRADNTQSTALGNDPLDFSVTGKGTIVWKVDTSALASALVGKTSAEFQGVINNFKSIQEARARIEPFWKSVFPANPSDIQIVLETPKQAN